jgi:hypothetical protein
MTRTSFTASYLTSSGQTIDKVSYGLDEALAFSGVHLVESQLLLLKSQQARELADLFEQLGGSPAAKLVMAFFGRASDEHHSIGTLLKGLKNHARAHLAQTIHLERTGAGREAETLSSSFLEALVRIPVASNDDNSRLGFVHPAPLRQNGF